MSVRSCSSVLLSFCLARVKSYVTTVNTLAETVSSKSSRLTPHSPSKDPVRQHPAFLKAVTACRYQVSKANVSLGRHGKCNGVRPVIGVSMVSIVFWYEPQTKMPDRDYFCGISSYASPFVVLCRCSQRLGLVVVDHRLQDYFSMQGVTTTVFVVTTTPRRMLESLIQ
jgi:hypothetical protein